MPLERISSTTILQMESEPIARVVIDGANCLLRVGPDVVMDCMIMVHAEVVGARIEIGRGCRLGGMIHLIGGRGGVVRIGANTTMTNVGISMHEGAEVVIGRDCMFSTDIHMDTSDMHPIYDRATGERVNPPKGIHFGDHVWLGTRVLVLKGARVGSGSIIGAGSMVAGEIPENVLALGSPARVVRENVVWTRDMDETPELFPESGPKPEPAPPARKKGWFR